MRVDVAAIRSARSWARQRLRVSEAVLILLAVAIGGAAGLLSVVQGAIALALFSWITKARARHMVDAVEANALHRGRMSWSDNLVISGQTIISNGFGASIGLEAAYAQLGGVLGSIAGGWFRLRRADLRILVGAGTGAAIAGAFGAPLAGAFYAFEIVIGAYTPAAIALARRCDHRRVTGVVDDRPRDVRLFVLDVAASSSWRDHRERSRCWLGPDADRRTDDAKGGAGDACSDHCRGVSSPVPSGIDQSRRRCR